jgi:hypothetical protein
LTAIRTAWRGRVLAPVYKSFHISVWGRYSSHNNLLTIATKHSEVGKTGASGGFLPGRECFLWLKHQTTYLGFFYELSANPTYYKGLIDWIRENDCAFPGNLEIRSSIERDRTQVLCYQSNEGFPGPEVGNQIGDWNVAGVQDCVGQYNWVNQLCAVSIPLYFSKINL